MGAWRTWADGVVLAVLPILIILALAWLVWPMGVHWADRRPIGVLFLASNGHASARNPRGWFNEDTLDVTGPGGEERFRTALFAYADKSIAVLKRAGAQGVIAWDVEGEEFPHKTTYIGDPRLLKQFAPEMAPLAGEFFKRFRDAGFRVGVTIRPQQIVYVNGLPHQSAVLDMKRLLLEKIDYARTNWGATLFYIDSNDSFWRPDEMWQLRSLAAARPDVLLIPEHHCLPYWAFSAPYVPVHKGRDAPAARAHALFPHSFEALDVGDATGDELAAAWHPGDILLFRAWFWNNDCLLLQNYQNEPK